MRGALVCALMLLLLQSCENRTAPVEQCFINGNTFYQQKKWDSAAHYYQLCVASHSINATVYYNLGNSWYRLGKMGYAVLAYKQALKRRPDYKAAADNLSLAENKLPNRVIGPEPVFFQRWWQAMTRPDRAELWAIVALIFFTLAITMLIARKIGKGGSFTTIRVIVIAFILWILCLVMAFASAMAVKTTNEAVVIVPSVTLRQSGSEQSAGMGKVTEGTVARLDSAGNTWLSVTLPDGRVGWLPTTAARVVN